mmetsp:Transcript_3601/g.13169  ORF Transcript_3601/g.13169 Transcript_3601/m.13169 type:complete len:475 (+) Transcript_3601:992-2416(+)
MSCLSPGNSVESSASPSRNSTGATVRTRPSELSALRYASSGDSISPANGAGGNSGGRKSAPPAVGAGGVSGVCARGCGAGVGGGRDSETSIVAPWSCKSPPIVEAACASTSSLRLRPVAESGATISSDVPWPRWCSSCARVQLARNCLRTAGWPGVRTATSITASRCRASSATRGAACRFRGGASAMTASPAVRPLAVSTAVEAAYSASWASMSMDVSSVRLGGVGVGVGASLSVAWRARRSARSASSSRQRAVATPRSSARTLATRAASAFARAVSSALRRAISAGRSTSSTRSTASIAVASDASSTNASITAPCGAGAGAGAAFADSSSQPRASKPTSTSPAQAASTSPPLSLMATLADERLKPMATNESTCESTSASAIVRPAFGLCTNAGAGADTVRRRKPQASKTANPPSVPTSLSTSLAFAFSCRNLASVGLSQIFRRTLDMLAAKSKAVSSPFRSTTTSSAAASAMV